MSEFNVFSMFDGISCGQQALKNCGIPYTKYIASEIHKTSIKVTQDQHPNTIQYGNCLNIKKYHFLSEINLLMGGSPCQGFSFAGKRLNFDDPRSRLFFEFVRMKNELSPDYFFLENVKMDKQSEAIITDYMGVEPILVNSSLVSAQNRERLYWTNISGFEMPMDKRIIVADILDNGYRKTKPYTENKTVYDAKSFTRCIQVGNDYSTAFEQRQRIYSKNAKSPTIDTGQGGKRTTKIAYTAGNFIDLNINELERLQTLPDNYTKCVSKSAGAFGIGNGWNVATVMEFFKHLPK